MDTTDGASLAGVPEVPGLETTAGAVDVGGDPVEVVGLVEPSGTAGLFGFTGVAPAAAGMPEMVTGPLVFDGVPDSPVGEPVCGFDDGPVRGSVCGMV